MTIQDYLQQLNQFLTIEPETMAVEEDDEFVFVKYQVNEEDAGKMIGRHGETISALANILTVTFHDQLGEKRVVVDINSYKAEKEDEAVEIGRELAERAIETGRPQYLPYSLQAHQRRVVHQALQDTPGIYTESKGEGRYRRLVIYPANTSQEE